MRLLVRNNYLHYGDSLEQLKRCLCPDIQGKMYKEDLIQYLEGQGIRNQYLNEVVLSYGGKRRKKINMRDLEYDVDSSLKFQEVFKKLRCRGFSYCFFERMMGFPLKLRKEVNLRFALMTNGDLFFPPKVRNRLTRLYLYNHYTLDSYPSIAFALGSIVANDWYIFVIQSDLVFKKPAALREHFRGWRRILFFNILQYARKKARSVYLCRARDVLRCCHPEYWIPEELPRNWEIFYDETARFFNMKIVKVRSKIDIQIFDRHKPVYVNRLYKLGFLKSSSNGK